MEFGSKKQIVARRKEIEAELMEMLKATGSDFSLEDVKDAIYSEEDSDDMMKIIAMFDRGGDASELENILELATDAWNYFPHKITGGKSPADVLLEYHEKNPQADLEVVEQDVAGEDAQKGLGRMPKKEADYYENL